MSVIETCPKIYTYRIYTYMSVFHCVLGRGFKCHYIYVRTTNRNAITSVACEYRNVICLLVCISSHMTALHFSYLVL